MRSANTNLIFQRVGVADALRGFAIMAAMLLHNIEHFDYYYFPDYLPEWVKTLDTHVWNTMFVLFSGKAYAIFAVLFGFTFFLMDRKQRAKGIQFGPRFLWRMLLLFAFGIVNSMFYSGDVLALYAVLGFSLVLVSNLRSTSVLVIALVLFIQPFEIGRLIYMLLNNSYAPGEPLSWHYFGKSTEYLSSHSFIDTAWGNLTNGRWACTLWSWEHGRIFQVPALFMVGFVLGRASRFEDTKINRRFWVKMLLIAFNLVILFVALLNLANELIHSEIIVSQIGLLIETWNNVAVTFIWIPAFVLLFYTPAANKLLSRFEVFGKMSLTNYVMQSVLGCMIYNACGLGLYQYTGASLSLLVGIILFVIQYKFCVWWLEKHKQGPLEGLWHKLTWINLKKEFSLA